MSPASKNVDVTPGMPAHPDPVSTMWYEMTCCARGRMTGEKTFAGGTSTPQGEDASTRKNSAPVSLTVCRTCDNGSMPVPGSMLGSSAAARERRRACRHNVLDDSACGTDVWSWDCRMPRAYPVRRARSRARKRGRRERNHDRHQ